MPEFDDGTDDNVNDDASDDNTQDSKAVRQMRQRIQALEKDSKDINTLRRENAMLKAGIDTSTKLGKMFANSYDGDFADIEAVKAEAVEIGLLKVDAADTTTTTDTKEAVTDTATTTDTSTSERQTLSSGALPDDAQKADPRATGLQNAEDAIKKGASFEKAAGDFIGGLARAAQAGDQRVLVQ